MKDLVLTWPDDLAQWVHPTGEELGAERRLMAALKMFELGKLSSGKAAELAGLSLGEFFEACGRYRVVTGRFKTSHLGDGKDMHGMNTHRDNEARRGEADDPLTWAVIGAAIEVHRTLGPGLLESAYQECLCCELRLRGIEHLEEVELPVSYKGIWIDCGYRMDIVVPELLVVELKAVAALLPVHQAQLLTYLRLSGIRRGLLINFNVPVLVDGVKRMVI